ncbi:MAG: hypothetical protein C5B53_00485 [Candidatus Melainabacteria bacterium]|nr:MAG: hypothetical protein C5B53_00485 [Candidatus Melainabacteria bacterium]
MTDQQIDTSLLRWFRITDGITAAVVMILAATIVAGRVLDIEALKIATGGAGLGMLFCALSLLLFLADPYRRLLSKVAYAFAFAAVLLSGVNLARYFMDLELVNTFSRLDVGGFQLALLVTMSPSDAIMITLIGLSLLLRDVSFKGFRPSELISFIATLACLMTMLGVILEIDTFCMFYACAKISPVVGVAFGMLGLATLCARPSEGFVSLLLSQNAGGASARRLIPSALIIPLAVSSVRMYVFRLGLPEEFGMTFMVAAMMLSFALLLCWNSWSIENLDTARQRAMLKATQSERRTRMVIQQAIDAFIAVDADGTIKDWNQRATDTFGFLREEALGKSLFELIVPEKLTEGAIEAIKEFLSRSKSTAPSRPLESYAKRKDGVEFPVELSLFPVDTESERLMCAFVRDITERKMIEQRFKEFYSTASHELRSPLTSIRGSLSLIKDLWKNVPQTAQEMLNSADNSLDRLVRLVNDMLDVKRIQEAQLNLELVPLDPVWVVTTAVDGLRAMAAKAEVELEVMFDSVAIFTGDVDRVVQVLTNLVSNAIKFTPPGKMIVVRVTNSVDAKRLRFLVEDQGPGISPEQLPKLFNKFAQLADGQSKLGTGLGLFISKAIVEEHGGVIGVESSVGKGTTFWFELPLTPPQPIRTELKSEALQHLDIEA